MMSNYQFSTKLIKRQLFKLTEA